jgi:hypothetical protein
MKYFIAWLLAVSACAFGGNYTTQFDRLDCPTELNLKFNAHVYDNRVKIYFLNESESIYRISIADAFLYIPDRGWQSGLTDVYGNRPASATIHIPPGKVNAELFPLTLIKETDAEWKDVKWHPWPCLNCQIQLALPITADGKTIVCKLQATTQKTLPKEMSQRYR